MVQLFWSGSVIVDRKMLKEKSRESVKKTYLRSVLVIFIFTLIMGGYSNITKSNSNYETIKNVSEKTIVEDKKSSGVLAPLVNQMTKDHSAIISFANAYKFMFKDKNISKAVLSLMAAIVFMLFYIFIKLVLSIGKYRYFLESRVYRETKTEKILFPYRSRKVFNIAKVIFIRNFFQLLWDLTIIGGFIKYYEYRMIEYVMTENPDIKYREAFSLSKEMMMGLKWQTFILDLSLIGWTLLSVFTLGFSDLLFSGAYVEFIYSELYMSIRRGKKSLTYAHLLNDEYLDAREINGEYPLDKYKVPLWYKKDFKSDYMQKYSIVNLILFFFTFAFVGWLWEVLLCLLTDGVLVNRGTMLGPWLPIYGFGIIFIIIILKPFRKRPVIYFVMAILLSGALEYSAAWYLETFKHMKWWDYSGYFLNLHGRICFEGLIVFGLGACIVTYFLCPLLVYYYKKIDKKLAIIICTVLLTLFGIDFVYSSVHPNVGKGITSYSCNVKEIYNRNY